MRLPFGDGLLFDKDDVRRRPYRLDQDRPVRGTKYMIIFRFNHSMFKRAIDGIIFEISLSSEVIIRVSNDCEAYGGWRCPLGRSGLFHTWESTWPREVHVK